MNILIDFDTKTIKGDIAGKNTLQIATALIELGTYMIKQRNNICTEHINDISIDDSGIPWRSRPKHGFVSSDYKLGWEAHRNFMESNRE